MDTMITMMEKYTDHLEDIVAERTSELAAEKAKTDELLYRMLPRYRGYIASRAAIVKKEQTTRPTAVFSSFVSLEQLAEFSSSDFNTYFAIQILHLTLARTTFKSAIKLSRSVLGPPNHR